MMTRRENIEATLLHQPHDHVADFKADAFKPGGQREFWENGPAGGGMDGFGCKWATSESALGAGLPEPGYVVLEDVTAWEDVVQFPDLDKIDFAAEAEKQMAGVDRNEKWIEYSMWNGPFLRLTHLMGFEDGLCAMYEEPEACKALLNAIVDYKIKVAERIAEHFKPDSICTFDDFATERGPFISPEVYRDQIKPAHIRFNNAVKEMGIIPTMHVCGKTDILVPDMVEEGIAAWEICQPENDLVTLGKKYGDKLVFIGGFDMIGPLCHHDPIEEELIEETRRCIDLYAPQGNYVFNGLIMYSDPMKFMKAGKVMSDEAVRYGTNYYNR